jgi:hypothetical protein
MPRSMAPSISDHSSVTPCIALLIKGSASSFRLSDECREVREAVLPEQIDALVLLNVFQICNVIDTAQDRAGYNLRAAKLIVPMRGLAPCVMHETLVGIHG